MPAKFIPVFIKLSEIDENKKINEVTKEERKRMVKLLKEFTLNVEGVVGFNKSIVTTGGVEIKQINPKTMRSKIISNLFLAGEVMDLEGPCGGYNLQVAWSTGYTVGENFV